MYLRGIELNLPFLNLYVVLIIYCVFDVHWVLIGLNYLLLCLRCPSECRYLRVYVVRIGVAVFVQDILGLARPLPISLFLMINLVLKHLPKLA